MADSSAQSRRRWSWRELQGVSCRSFTRFQNPVAKIVVKIVLFLFLGLSVVISGMFHPSRTLPSHATKNAIITSGDLRNIKFVKIHSIFDLDVAVLRKRILSVM
jgi:hypothetical protein